MNTNKDFLRGKLALLAEHNEAQEFIASSIYENKEYSEATREDARYLVSRIALVNSLIEKMERKCCAPKPNVNPYTGFKYLDGVNISEIDRLSWMLQALKAGLTEREVWGDAFRNDLKSTPAQDRRFQQNSNLIFNLEVALPQLITRIAAQLKSLDELTEKNNEEEVTNEND